MDLPYQIVERNLRQTMRFFAASKDDGEVNDLPGVTVVCSGVNYAVFNAAMLSTPVPGAEGDLGRRVSMASVHFAARGLRWSYWVCEDLLDAATRRRARRIFSDYGLRPLVEPPGMLAERLEPPVRALPQLEYRRVEDAATRFAFCDVTSIAFDLPFSISREIYDSERAWRTGMTGWVGYHLGKPVTTAATVDAAGAIGIYSVATLPQHQRRGYAEAIMRYSLDRARDASGPERTVLQSSKSGFQLYKRMGYETVTQFVVYLSS